MVFTEATRAMAWKELTDKMRNRWVLLVALAFLLFTLIIAYFGAAPAGVMGFRRIETTLASLTSLVSFFIPLMALTLGGGIIADERERGTMELLLASPISAAEFIVGKFLGLLVAMTLALVVGVGSAGVLLGLKTGPGGLLPFGRFLLNCIILGLVFLSISLFISVLLYERSKVVAFTVLVWLFYTILYDLGVIGVVLVTKGEIGMGPFTALLLLNPVDVFRLLNFLSIGEFRLILGLTAVEFPSYINTASLLVVSLLWLGVPLIGTMLIYRRRY